MAEAPGVQPSPPTPDPTIHRLGDVPTPALPVIYSGQPLQVPNTYWERMGAAFRDNWLGAVFSTPTGPTYIDSSFDPVAAANRVQIAQDREWLSQARNQAEFDAMQRYSSLRRQDRAIALENPLTHMFFNAALDPLTYAPIGSTWIRGAANVGERFARGAAVGAITFGGSEAVRAFADPQVNLSDSMTSIVGGTIMGGLIGASMRYTRPAASGVGRYLDGQVVDAAALAREEGASFLHSDRFASEVPRETPRAPPRETPATPATSAAAVADELAAVRAAEQRAAARRAATEHPPGTEVAPETIGRIGPADDWGLPPKPAGAAPTPMHMVTQTGEFKPLPTGIGLERLGMSPVQRLISSSIDAVGEGISKLAQIPYQVRRNLRGLANPANVQSDQYVWHGMLAQARRTFDEAFMEHRGVGRVRASVQDAVGSTPAGKLSASEFDARVHQRLLGQVDDALPEVNKAARAYRGIYERMGDEASAHGMFNPDAVRTPKRWQTSEGEFVESYVNRHWHTNQILANRPAFLQRVERWLQISGGDVSRASKIVDDITLDRPFRAIDDEHVGMATSAHRRGFDAPSSFFSDWLITDPTELLSTYVRTMGVDISLARHAGGVTAKGLIDNATEEWFRAIGRGTGANGDAIYAQLAKDLEAAGKDASAAYRALGDHPALADIALVREQAMGEKAAAFERARTGLNAPEAQWRQMHAELDDLRAVRDVLRGTYGQWDVSRDWIPRTLASARKIAMMSGLTGVVSQLSDVGALVLKEGFTRTFGTAYDLLRAGMQDIKMSAHELHLSGTGLDMRLASRAMAMGDLSTDIAGRHNLFERVLDKATQASFYVNGMNPWSAFMKGWAGAVIGSRILEDVEKVGSAAVRMPLVKQRGALMAESEELRVKIDGRSLGRRATPQEITAWRARRTAIGTEIDQLGQVSHAESLHSTRIEHELLGDPDKARFIQREIDALHDPQAIARLARSGIDPEVAALINIQERLHGNSRDTMRMPNTERWSNAAARDAFRRAMAEDVDNAIVSADGPSRSLYLSRPMGQTLGMFHAYGQAVMQKLLIPALQEKDSRLLAGIALMIGGGYLSDQLRRWATGDNRQLSAGETLNRAIDRSGVTGWFGQLFNAGYGMFDTRHGPAFAGEATAPPGGMSLGMAMSSDGMIRALGPVASRTRDLADLTFRTATMGWGKETARDARRLLPLNNVTHTHFAFDALERMLAGAGRSEPPVQAETRRARPPPRRSGPSLAPLPADQALPGSAQAAASVR